MTYFNYHAKVKNLITRGHCTGARILEEYHGICPALLLFFDNHPPMPIREYKWQEYFLILKSHGITMANENILK